MRLVEPETRSRLVFFILIWGEVDVLGLISAALTLRLSATYAGWSADRKRLS